MSDKISKLDWIDVLTFRYDFTLYWYCNIGEDIHPEIKAAIRGRVFQVREYDWWPAAYENKKYISDLIWFAFPTLRTQVYFEFVQIAYPHMMYDTEKMKPKISGHIKIDAYQMFTESMTDHFTDSKPTQMEYAAHAYRTKHRKTENEPGRHIIIDSERQKRWRQLFSPEPEPESHGDND